MSVFVKICGITSEEDALGAVAMGADAIGFVFAPSKRQIDRTTARDIIRRLPQNILSVGVFQNNSKENVARIANNIGLKAIQLHGSEPPDYIKWIKRRNLYVIKSFVGGSSQLMEAKKWKADVVLIDGSTPGSGQVFDWEQAENAPEGLRILLAGGLTPENVASAVMRVEPWGVDVSTGVEISPGKKDLTAIRDFVSATKSAAENFKAPVPFEENNENDKPFNWETDF